MRPEGCWSEREAEKQDLVEKGRERERETKAKSRGSGQKIVRIIRKIK